MSAFMVEGETINRVADAILHVLRPHETVLGIGRTTNDPGPALARKLYALNAKAIGERYGKAAGKAAIAEAEAHTYRPTHHEFGAYQHPGLVQFVKSFACFTYQCSEGKVAKSKAFREVEMMEGRLCRDAVDQIKGYDAAEWG